MHDWQRMYGHNPESSSDVVGRDPEMAVLDSLLDEVGRGGRAMVVRGEPGSGKSSLLQWASDGARARGMGVLIARGSPAEAHVERAALYSLVRPLLSGTDRLASIGRSAFSDTFGAIGSSVAEPVTLGLATLELLAEYAVGRPLLVIVDDAQWVDRSTVQVLASLARRLPAERIVLLISTVDSEDGFTGLAELRLGRLDNDAAARVVQRYGAGIPAALRTLVLSDAGGNPLALKQLATGFLTAMSEAGPIPLPVELPIGESLGLSYAAQIAKLPVAAQSLLLLAACEQGPPLSDVLSALTLLAGPTAAHALESAAAAQIVVLDGFSVRFAHPLLRSAAYQLGDVPTRRAAHAALSAVAGRDRFRSAWHRALATAAPDAAVAQLLGEEGSERLRRGDMMAALLAFDRAAWLSTDSATRSRFVLAGASAAFELGGPQFANQFLGPTAGRGSGAQEDGQSWYARRVFAEPQSGHADVEDLTSLARLEPDRELGRRLVFRAASTSLWGNLDQRRRALVESTAALLSVDEDSWRLAVIAGSGSVDERDCVINRLCRIDPAAIDDPESGLALGLAAAMSQQHERATAFLSTAVDGFAGQGRLALMTHALALRSWARVQASQLDAASSDAIHAADLAERTGQREWRARALAASALIEAIRGDSGAAERYAETADRLAVSAANSIARADIVIARGHADLASGRNAEAARTLATIYRSWDPVGVSFHRLAAIADFAEASVRSGQPGAAEAAKKALAELTEASPPSVLAGTPQVAFARALLADDADMEDLFRAAMVPDLPLFLRGRVHLSYGIALRRARRTVASRDPLEQAARDFDVLNAASWAARARQELRATGVEGRTRLASSVQLTPQEALVARMAASGMSNKQIGQRLYLSPRTVGAHLYQVFPKLGVVSRGQLHRALGDTDASIAM